MKTILSIICANFLNKEKFILMYETELKNIFFSIHQQKIIY